MQQTAGILTRKPCLVALEKKCRWGGVSALLLSASSCLRSGKLRGPCTRMCKTKGTAKEKHHTARNLHQARLASQQAPLHTHYATLALLLRRGGPVEEDELPKKQASQAAEEQP